MKFEYRENPLAELITKSIVNVTATGERDPETIKERALNALGVRRNAAWGTSLSGFFPDNF